MLDQARTLAAQAGTGGAVSFQEADAEALPFRDGSFRYLTSVFGLMYVPAPASALAEFGRVLRDDGWMGLVVWALPRRTGCLRVTMASLAEAAAPAAVRWLLRRRVGEALLWRLLEDRIPGRGPSPARFGRPGRIERELEAAGFTDIAVQEHTEIWRYEDFDHFWRAFLRATPAAPVHPDRAPRVRRILAARCEEYRENGALAFPMTALVVKARRSAARPG